MTIEAGSPARWRRLNGPLYRLQGSNCFDCGEVHFPEKEVCPDCVSDVNRRIRIQKELGSEVIDNQPVPTQPRADLPK
jgi:uncharacterized OB-fold protein